MVAAGQRDVGRGPLAVRWHAVEPGEMRAGALSSARVEVENAGTVTWSSSDDPRIYVSYHWLDERGNPIVWAGIFQPFPAPVRPGERATVELPISAPVPPATYRLAFALLADGRCWFAEVGNERFEVDVADAPRIGERTLAVRIRPGDAVLTEETRAALEAQAEPVVVGGEGVAVADLVPGCLPAPDWSRRILDAHVEGYAAVGGAIEPVGGVLARRRLAARLAPWAPGGGRNPRFEHPLLCPSVVVGGLVSWLPDVEGLPALAHPLHEPWVYDGRIVVHVSAAALA